MNKGELIEAVAKDAGVSKALAGNVLDSVIGAVTKALKKGDRVALAGFGTFSVGKRKARTGRNPQTGKPIKIPAKKVAKFKAGAKLAKVVK
ncbi:MAG TPA: HU family DNA-binding protein [Syntrophaceae bacterium]|nr:HU family DNA-binding protein [Syntrophaceae bacterium]